MRRLGLQCTGGYVNIDEKIEWLTAAAAERGIYIYTVMRGMMVRRRSRSRWTTTVLRCDIFHEFQECSSFESNLSITCYYSRKKPILLAIRTTYYGTLIDSKIQTYSYINRTQTNTVERGLYSSNFQGQRTIQSWGKLYRILGEDRARSQLFRPFEPHMSKYIDSKLLTNYIHM